MPEVYVEHDIVRRPLGGGYYTLGLGENTHPTAAPPAPAEQTESAEAASKERPEEVFLQLARVQAADFRFLRQPSTRTAPRSVANNGRAAVSGVGTKVPPDTSRALGHT
jgi:hypothetical protein